MLEEVVASLEKAKYGLCFSSGLGAANTVIHTLKAGDHLVAMGDVYGGIYRMFDQCVPNNGVEVQFVDLEDASTLTKYIKNNTKVRMCWILGRIRIC